MPYFSFYILFNYFSITFFSFSFRLYLFLLIHLSLFHSFSLIIIIFSSIFLSFFLSLCYSSLGKSAFVDLLSLYEDYKTSNVDEWDDILEIALTAAESASPLQPASLSSSPLASPYAQNTHNHRLLHTHSPQHSTPLPLRGATGGARLSSPTLLTPLLSKHTPHTHSTHSHSTHTHSIHSHSTHSHAASPLHTAYTPAEADSVSLSRSVKREGHSTEHTQDSGKRLWWV